MLLNVTCNNIRKFVLMCFLILFLCSCLFYRRSERYKYISMTQTVQTNGIQPLSKTWELSLYELQRTPQVREVTCENITCIGCDEK